MTALLTPLRATLVVVAVLAGLFAMHGLTHHGEHLPAHESAAHGAAAHQDAAPDGGAPGTGGTSDGGAMAMCLAMLLTGLLAWAGVRRPRGGLLLRLPPAGALAVAGPPSARPTGPPGRWELSVCRC